MSRTTDLISAASVRLRGSRYCSFHVAAVELVQEDKYQYAVVMPYAMGRRVLSWDPARKRRVYRVRTRRYGRHVRDTLNGLDGVETFSLTDPHLLQLLIEQRVMDGSGGTGQAPPMALRGLPLDVAIHIEALIMGVSSHQVVREYLRGLL